MFRCVASVSSLVLVAHSVLLQKKTKGSPDPVTKSTATTTTAKSVESKPETVVANSKPIVATKKSDVPVNAPTRRPSGTVNAKPAAPSKAVPTTKPTRARLGSGIVGNGPTASPARALRTASTVTSPPPKIVRSTSKTIVSSPKLKPTLTTSTGPHKKAEIPGTKYKPSGAENRNKIFSPVRDPLGNSHGGGADISGVWHSRVIRRFIG